MKLGKEQKHIPIGKEEVKFSLFTDNLIIYLVNPMESLKELLELTNDLVRLNKITIQKSIVFLCSSNKRAVIGIIKTILLLITSENEVLRDTSDKRYTRLAHLGNSLAVQWLGRRAFTAEG